MTSSPDAFALQSWLGPDFAIALSPPGLAEDELFPEEQAYIAGAARRRQAEFTAVRICARRALSSLGVPASPLVPRADRSPSWPEGIVGSLSHCQDLCIAAATTAPHIRSFGIDVEQNAALDDDIGKLICASGERAFVDARPAPERGGLRKLIFSAKEAIYKCQYPLTKAFLDFEDVELNFTYAAGAFNVSQVPRRREILELLLAIRGRYWLTDAFIFTVATLYRG